jgi:serine/threonine protein kinase
MFHSDRPHSGESARRLSTWASRVRLPWLSRLAALFAVGIALVGLGVDRAARHESEQHLRSDLENSLASYEAILATWAQGLEAVVAEAAREPSLTAEVRDLERLRDQPDALRASSALARLRERLAPLTGDTRAAEFAVLDARGRCLAASDDVHVGAAINDELSDWLHQALAGAVAVTPPLELTVLTAPDHPDHLEPRVTALVSAPVTDRDGEPKAVLAFLVDLNATLSRLLSTFQLESQGADAYAFDGGGRRIAGGTHRAALVALGHGDDRLDRAAPGPTLRDPGGDLLSGFRPTVPTVGLPLVRPVALALSGTDGYDTEGYRSYTGRYVVGAWKWLTTYGLGIVTERDRDAVFRHHRVPRFAISMASGIALMSAFAGLLSSWAFARLAQGAEAGRAVGPYELLERIGVGAMGEVFLAQHALLRRPTAIKLIHSDVTGSRATRRFESEVATTASLSHPNTISIYDYGRTSDGTLYFAMEYLRGFTVGKMVERFGAVPEPRALLILARIASALAEAHGIGFVHGDISSQNVMLCKLGGIADFVKILDFGLARRADLTPQRTDEEVVGTPAFMAPEAFDHSSPIGPRTDLYAIGALGYYLVTGHAPFELANAFQIYEAHLRTPVPRPSERAGHPIDPTLEQVLLDCLEKDPERRPAGIAVLESRLRACPGFGAWTLADADRWWNQHAAQLVPKLESFPSAEEDLAAARAKTVALLRPPRP